MQLFLRVRFDPSETGTEHSVRIHGIDTGGTVILMGTEEFRLPEREDAFQDVTFNIEVLQFHRYGKHTISVFLDEERKQVVEFRVEKANEPSTDVPEQLDQWDFSLPPLDRWRR